MAPLIAAEMLAKCFRLERVLMQKSPSKKDKKIMMSDLISKLTKLTQHTERQVAVVLTYCTHTHTHEKTLSRFSLNKAIRSTSG